MHDFDKNIRQNFPLYHPNFLKIMFCLHKKNCLDPVNGPEHKNNYASAVLIVFFEKKSFLDESQMKNIKSLCENFTAFLFNQRNS